MNMDKKNDAITSRDVDFAKWYTDVCRKAELMDYSPVKGFINYLPYGYGIWETFAWIPRECVFPGNSEDTVCLYRIWQRAGQFTSMEYYAEAQEVPVLDEREDAVLVEDLYLSYYETLVCETSLPLSNGQTVIWLNPEG